MSGMICACVGFQRSGKSLLAYLLSEYFRTSGDINVYTNITAEGFVTIESLNDIPLDYLPKVLYLDEAYYFLDSRNWKNNTDASIFFNTIAKQNICLLLTTINMDMLEKRIREQLNYLIIAKPFGNQICYRIHDIQRQRYRDFCLEKTPELFSSVKYNTLQIPDWIDVNIKDFRKRVQSIS